MTAVSTVLHPPVRWSANIADWHASTRWRPLGTDAIEGFAPNHVGLFVLGQPLPPGVALRRLQATLTFLTHEDYDFAGLSIGLPHRKENLLGVSLRNQTVEVKALALKAPFAVQLHQPVSIAVAAADSDLHDALTTYRLTVNDEPFAELQRRPDFAGVFFCEAHVRIDHIRVELDHQPPR